VEGTSENQKVIAGELAHARMELSIVDETSGLAYDEERKDNPT
jgi:hypothetical protein